MTYSTLRKHAIQLVLGFAIVLFSSSAFGQLTGICAIQGNGGVTPFAGQVVTTRGIITAAYQGTGTIGGYFIEDPACDTDPLTSNGLFVYDPTGATVTVGDLVEVTGTISEYNTLTEMSTITAFTVISSGNAVVPSAVSFPVPVADFLERYEGMLMVFPQTLTATDNYNWGRYGEVTLCAGDRLSIPTDIVDPNDDPATGTTTSGNSNVPAVTALADLNARSRILLDDGRSVSYPVPPPYLDPNGTFRCGSTVTDLQGVLTFAFGVNRLYPVGAPAWNYAARPPVPSPSASLRVVSFNVLNYWSTLGGWGAQTATEFDRQRTKLVAAITEMNADVLGLMELENNGSAAYQDLLDALNMALGAGTYAALDATSPGLYQTKSVIFYKPAVVSLAAPLDALNDAIIERPILTQAFTHASTGASFLFCLNHLRFKGCDGATGLDLDQNDGQACFNATRTAQAELVVARLTELVAQTGIDRVLIAGDFNAYSQEDPMDVIDGAGYTSLLEEGDYSYGYQAQWGALDHAFTSPNLLPAVVNAQVWNCNSDEPRALDWADIDSANYQPNAYRSSDHDPVVIDIDAATINTGIEEFVQIPDVRVFPLPCTDAFTVSCAVQGASRMRLELFDACGRTVAVHSQSATPNSDQRMVVPTEQFAPGAYGYRLIVSTGDGEQRFQGTVLRAR
ncbi:MAG: ExeM/NucH family extracellular endonuclease [Flavobacteriales bacterium]|nr:ExeM/NucH family extracellular endonuclease [Flavobacteriales bacterium]